VLAAVEDAAKQAGCDTAALRKGAKPFVLLPGPKVVDSYDVVIVGAGGAGMAAAAQAAQDGASVLVIEKLWKWAATPSYPAAPSRRFSRPWSGIPKIPKPPLEFTSRRVP
jgi:NADPH-dependent 2,4-dienoyl-CoA reductase/sulfur reductase-like enzyme